MTDWKRERRRSINNRELLLAASDNDFDEVNRLINDYVDVNFRDKDGFTALHFAAEFADPKVVQVLIDAGAIVDNKNNNQETPLDIAKRLNRTDVVSIFEALLNQNSPEPSVDVVEDSVIQQNQQVAVTNGFVVTNGFHKIKQEIWINPVHSNIYQLKILMLFLYRGIACKYSFHLGTEIEKARKFDNLVFEYTQNSAKVYRLLHAKHKIDETKKITVDKLLSEISSDYCLIKYFHSYQASKNEAPFKNGVLRDIIICTNIDFDYENLKEAQIELQKIEEKDDILDVVIDGNLPMKYKFTNSILPKLSSKLKQCRFGTRQESDSEIIDFLQCLIFAVNQPNEDEVGNIVKKEIGKEFEFLSTENAYNKFIVRMLDWMKSRHHRDDSFWSYDEGKEFFDEMKKEIPIWYEVQSPVKSFTGRIEQLEKMHKLLEHGSKTTICISGLGGLGKSELVKKYISKHSHCYDDKIVWINAENYQSLVRSFRKLAQDKLGISTLNTDGKEKEVKSLVAETYQYFSNGNSLFVFDNAEVYQSYSKFDSGIERFLPSLPHSCKKPHVIVTSRNQKWPKSIKVLLLEAFSREEATTFVLNSLQLKDNEQMEQVIELGEKLQLMPLAMQQAVAYIAAQNDKLHNIGTKFKITDYLDKLSDQGNVLLNFEIPEECDSKYAKTVLTTWNVTSDAIRSRNDGCDALSVMTILSYLLPDNIPVDLLLMFTTRDKETLASVIELLKQYSLIDVQHKHFNVHRSMQQVIRMKLVESDAVREILVAVDVAKIESRNIDHFVCLWMHAKRIPKLVEDFHQVSENITRVMHICGRFKEMEIETKNHVQRQPTKHDIQKKLQQLDTRTLMAGALLDKGRGTEALKEFRKIYEAQRTLRGANTRETLSAKRNLAYALRSLEKHEEALKCYEELLRDSRLYLGENDPETLTTRNNIATFLIDEEKYDEALAIFQEIYDVQKLIYNEKDDNVLTTKNNIANVLFKLGKTEEALQIWMDIHDIQKRKLSESHPDVLLTRSSIANVLFEQEKYADALEIYEDLLRIKSKIYGEEHSDVVDVRVDIACTLKMQGKFNDALIILHELLKKQIGESGLYNPHVPKTLNAMASVLYDQEKYPEAFKTYQELLSCQITMFGRDDLKTVNTRGFIAGILCKQGKYDNALEYYQEMFRITNNVLGMNHRMTLAARHEIGVMALFKKEYDKAWDILTEVLVAQESLLGREHMDYFRTLKNLSIVSAHREKLGNQSSSNGTSKSMGPVAAITNNDLVLLKNLVKDGADVNTQDRNLQTLLHHAVMVNQPSIVKYLLSNGADVNRVNSKGETPLHVAASKGHLAIVKIILDHLSYHELQGYVDARTVTENTAVHLAAVNGFADVTIHLLTRGATYDLKNQNDQLPVDLAVDRYLNGLLRKVYVHSELAKYGVEEVYNQLQRHSHEEYLALVNARNSQGYTMLSIALTNKRESVVNLLVKLRVDKTHSIHVMSSFNSNLNELLAHASIARDTLENDKSSFQKIVDDISDLVSVFRTHDKDSSDSNMIVIEDTLQLLENHEEAISLLKLAKLIVRKHLMLFTRSICTIQLYEAAKNNDLVSVQELVAKNIDVDVRDKGGWTPLHFAINVGNERMAELLLARGAEVNCTTNMGKFTPLHIAVNKSYVKVVELLLSRCSKSEFVDAKTEAKGSTALHIATKNDQPAIVTLLLARGASYCMRNKDGQSPADLATDQTIKDMFGMIDELFADAEKGRPEVIEKLKAMGPGGIQTVIRVRNDEGFSMTEVAALKDHRELASQILNMVKTTFNLPDSLGIPKIMSKKKK